MTNISPKWLWLLQTQNFGINNGQCINITTDQKPDGITKKNRAKRDHSFRGQPATGCASGYRHRYWCERSGAGFQARWNRTQCLYCRNVTSEQRGPGVELQRWATCNSDGFNVPNTLKFQSTIIRSLFFWLSAKLGKKELTLPVFTWFQFFSKCDFIRSRCSDRS